jgi:DNA-binding PadR family transcriptional regulator
MLLGLLLDGPCHGYNLARAFAPGTALGRVAHLGPSHVYALLAHLERDGLLSGERLEQAARPPRRVYQITEAGRSAVLHWVEEPVARPRDTLLDFPLKLYLARHLDPARAQALVAGQRARFVAYLAELEHEDLRAYAAEDAAFLRLLLDGRIRRTRDTLAWLDCCAEMLREDAVPEAHPSPLQIETSQEIG